MKKTIKENIGFMLVSSVLLLFILFSSCARASGYIDVGPTQIKDNLNTGWMITLNQSFGDNDQFDISLGAITRQEFDDGCDCYHSKWKLDQQIFIGATAWASDPWSGKFKVGIGPYWFQNKDRVAPANLRIGVFFRYDINDRWSIMAKHFSTAGSSEEGCVVRRMGAWDVVGYHTPIDYTTMINKEQNTFTQCNDWNTGQDSFFRIAYRW